MHSIDGANIVGSAGSSSNTTPTHGNSSFLPELNSTPPMPTFQKPDPGSTGPACRSADQRSDVPKPSRSPSLAENTTPRRLKKSKPEVPAAEELLPDMFTLEQPAVTRPRTRPSTILFSRSLNAAETPPLPLAWTKQHDKAICILDVKNYSLPAIVTKMRRTFPALQQGTLTPAMIDKRLRQLDQNLEIDYYRAGLRKDDRAMLAPPSATGRGGGGGGGVARADSGVLISGSKTEGKKKARFGEPISHHVCDGCDRLDRRSFPRTSQVFMLTETRP